MSEEDLYRGSNISAQSWADAGGETGVWTHPPPGKSQVAIYFLRNTDMHPLEQVLKPRVLTPLHSLCRNEVELVHVPLAREDGP